MFPKRSEVVGRYNGQILAGDPWWVGSQTPSIGEW